MLPRKAYSTDLSDTEWEYIQLLVHYGAGGAWCCQASLCRFFAKMFLESLILQGDEMAIVSKSNGLLAEFAIFSVEPDKQAALIERVIDHIESVLKLQPGFAAGTVHRSRDGLRVTNYVQWIDRDAYVASQAFAGFDPPDFHLFEIFAEEPEGSQLQLSPEMDGLINLGIFKMKKPENQPRFIELFQKALKMVSGQTGLISTHAHRSLDGWRCINFGHWHSLAEFTAMDSSRPFSPLFGEMLELADNEYQPMLHEVVFTTE
jgi:heme-degrading monooxygenase HmoA